VIAVVVVRERERSRLVAVCTIVPQRRSPQAKHPKIRKPVVVTARRVEAAKLQDVEDRLVEQALDHHPRAEAALDAALDDMAALSAELHRSRRRPLLLRSTSNLNRIEDLLLEAIVRTHPNRERALDRLMGDLVCPEVEPVVIEQAEFDMSFDNDFDGLG
jgi:hypothetical protein